MTAKEYFRQAYRLNQRINSDIAEVDELRAMLSNITSSALDEKVKRSRNGDAPFVSAIERIDKLERKIDAEVDLFVNLKEEMRTVIGSVDNPNEQMVLRYRYIHNYTWDKIGIELNADSRTIRRWHGKALNHVTLPKNPVKI